MTARIVTWLLFVSLSSYAYAQIRLMSPDSLVRTYENSNGRIEGSTTTIGAPFYGDRVLGRLVYGPSKKSHCEDDYTVPKPTLTHSQYQQAKLINIVVVRRGMCSFLKKVQIASAKGAHAVIIVDREDSNLKNTDMRNVVVHEDGFANGNDIHIPSVFVSKSDGRNLIRAIEGTEEVIIELSWDLPTNHTVKLDLWMSSASLESGKFLKEFSPKRKVLNGVVAFQPHYAVFAVDNAVSMDLCSDLHHNYCAEDPDGAGPVTGRDVLEEDVRQLCIHEQTKVLQAPAFVGGNSVVAVEYAAKYWDYMEQIMDKCPLDAQDRANRFGEECSRKLMEAVGIDVNSIFECFRKTKEEKLQHELENTAWSPRALRINGWRYSGIHDPELVTRAICAGFINQPAECTQLLKPRDPFKVYVPAKSKGMSFSFFLVIFFSIIGCSFAAVMFYKRYLDKEMRSNIREEVMLEVQAQMGEYSKMKGQP